jgi:hypothetical protein
VLGQFALREPGVLARFANERAGGLRFAHVIMIALGTVRFCRVTIEISEGALND